MAPTAAAEGGPEEHGPPAGDAPAQAPAGEAAVAQDDMSECTEDVSDPRPRREAGLAQADGTPAEQEPAVVPMDTSEPDSAPAEPAATPAPPGATLAGSTHPLRLLCSTMQPTEQLCHAM